MERQHFEFTIDDEQLTQTREEVIEIKNRLLRWALNDEAFHSAIVCEERQKFEKKYAHWKELEKAEAEERLVVLPCKVGDTVYSVDGKVAEAEEFHIDKRNVHITVNFECDYNCEHCAFNTWRQEYCGEYSCDGEWGEMTIPADELGKTVFLTREEAEAKLKE